MKKLFYTQDNIGKAKYTVSYTDGSTHKDGSPFYGFAIFKNKVKRNAFISELTNCIDFGWERLPNIEKGKLWGSCLRSDLT